MNHLEGLPNQFINWYEQPRVDGSGVDKIPCSPSGVKIDANDPKNWMTLEGAKATGMKVAFAISENDPYFFLDLDKCATNGEWSREAMVIWQSFKGALGEVSISNSGLHIIGKCDKSKLLGKRNKWDGWLEFYIKGRFIAFGDRGWNPVSARSWDHDKDWTDQLLKFVPDRPEMGDLTTEVDPSYTGPEDDNELIEKMLNSKGGAGVAFGAKATVKQLWEADPALCKIYPSFQGDVNTFDHNAADAALMAHLAFWTGKDAPRMERLFRRSALMRPKFERGSYRIPTMNGAVMMCKKVYDAPKKSSDNQSFESLLTVEEQKKHFDGCVYILDQHRMLTKDGRVLKPEQFNAMYGGHIFQMQDDNTKPEKKAFTAFTESRSYRFPKVHTSCFDPNIKGGEIVNDCGLSSVGTYFPEDVDIRNGNIDRFFEFMQKLIPDQNDRNILISWMASVVQNPAKKFQWAPVLQGAEGNGKTFLMNCVAHAIGESFVHRPNPEQLTATHNGWMDRKLFVIVEEFHMRDRRDVLDGLKTKITNEYLPLRAMHQDERTIKNFTKFGFCTNYMDAVLKNQNDRRYCMFFTAQQEYSDIIKDGMSGQYFPNLYDWAKSDGFAYVAHYLLNYKIPEQLDPAKWSVRAPMTTSTGKAIEKSLGMIEREIIEAIDENIVGFKGGFISSVMLSRLMERKRFKVSLNKRGDMLKSLGYIKHPGLKDGRATSVMIQEESKRPVIFIHKDLKIGDDPINDYMKAQGYTSET